MEKCRVSDTFFDRLNSLIRERASGKWTVFAKRAGIPHSTFRAYLNAKIPTAEHLLRIRDTYSISIDWLLTGKGEMTIREGSDALREPRLGDAGTRDEARREFQVFEGLTYDPRVEGISDRVSHPDLLMGIIEAVDLWLAKYQRYLSPEKKAEVIVWLYDHFMEKGRIEFELVARQLRLVS